MKKYMLTFVAGLLMTAIGISGCAKTTIPTSVSEPTEIPGITQAPTEAVAPETSSAVEVSPSEPKGQVFDVSSLVIGYEDSESNLSSEDEKDLLKACDELKIQCIRGNGISDLIEKKVSAIISASNPWRVLGAYPEIHEAVENGILEINVNGETEEKGAFNVSSESESISIALKWMFEELGGSGDFAYFNFNSNEGIQKDIDAILKEYPEINPISVPTTFENNTLTEPKIGELIAQNPNLGAIWANQFLNNLFWGLNSAYEKGGNLPLIVCEPKKEMLQSWKDRLSDKSSFKCIATIPPSGQYYESVYVAYYILSGNQIDPAAMGGIAGNTFKYDLPVITNENLEEWLRKMDTMKSDQGGKVFTPPLTPDEIKSKWFLE